jgi:hypothetical protein
MSIAQRALADAQTAFPFAHRTEQESLRSDRANVLQALNSVSYSLDPSFPALLLAQTNSIHPPDYHSLTLLPRAYPLNIFVQWRKATYILLQTKNTLGSYDLSARSTFNCHLASAQRIRSRTAENQQSHAELRFPVGTFCKHQKNE